MYEIYEQLLLLKGVTTAEVCRATGLNESSIANWKKRGGNCSMKTARKLSDYFEVSVDFFQNGDIDSLIEFQGKLASMGIPNKYEEALNLKNNIERHRKLKEIEEQMSEREKKNKEQDNIISIDDIPDKNLVSYIRRLIQLPQKTRTEIYKQIELQELKVSFERVEKANNKTGTKKEITGVTPPRKSGK